MALGKMSKYRGILQDLNKTEADVRRFYGNSKYDLLIRIESLRHKLIYIIPYWDSHLGGAYCLKRRNYFTIEGEFIDYWLEKVECSNGSSCEEYGCLWHTADYFYSSSFPEDSENGWVKLAEGALESLESVQHVEEVTLSMSDKFTTIKQGLGLLLCFHKSMANWSLEKLEKILTYDMSRNMEVYAKRAIRIFKQLPLTNVDGKSDISTLAEDIENYVTYWRVIMESKSVNINLEDQCGPVYETLICIAVHLQYLLFKLETSMMDLDFKRIRDQMDVIRCALSPTWTKIFVESGISCAIARDIYTSADEAYHVISASNLPKAQKIAHIRDVAWKIYKYNITPTSIDDFLRCGRLILGESVLHNTPAARYVKDLSLLHTFIKDTGTQLSMKFQDRYRLSMQFWSLCLRKSKSKKEFLTLSLDFFNDVTANMLKPGDLLVALIENVVQMPKANELLHDLRGSLVPAETDNLFVKLLCSLEKNLVKTLTTEGVVDVFEDVEVEVLEAAHGYILYFSQFNYDANSSLKEGAEGFIASLRHAFDEYTKFPCMELPMPMSDIEFFDFQLDLTHLKESDTYNSDQDRVLRDDLSVCFSFLHPYTMRHHKPEEVNLLWIQFTKLCRKVENMIHTFEEFPSWYNKLRAFYVPEEVKLIKEKLSKISSRETSKTEVEGSGARVENHMEKGHTAVHSEDEVSFEEEESLRIKLTRGSQSLENISIVGMPGLGKTTLAMRLYKDCAKSFNAHVWCYVGQEFRIKELLQYIIRQISERPSSEINDMRVEDLAILLKQCLLQKKNYLIVLDDVWDADVWDAIQICFPPSANGSRVLITSRYSNVGAKVCGDTNVVKLNLLTPDKSWHLLQKKVFGTRSYYPKRLCEVGKVIAEKCRGLPLSIVMIAGVLKNKNETEDGWKEIEWSLRDHLFNAGSSMLELSYRHISLCMKQCFLYCAAFSRGTEIPRSKLIRLWLAERFVETSNEQESLESAAENYLCELVDRSLLMVAKRGSDHRIQACRIHDLVLDFCIQKAKEEKLLLILDWGNDPMTSKLRGRICFPLINNGFVRSNFDGLTRLKPRSLIFSSGYHHSYEASENSEFESFKSLTLLDLENHEMKNFSAGIGELTLLRYLSFRGWMDSIPSSIGHLLNLETLIVKSNNSEVEVPGTIFSLSKLRDLQVDKRARISVHPSNDNSLSSLQNLSTPVFSGSIDDEIIVRLPNLRKLRCIFEDSFDLSILDRLCHLECLRVFYQNWSPFCGEFRLPSNLYKLTLSGFRLPWLDIEKIAVMLPRLEILKLMFRACEGEQWSTTATFKNLKYLRMEGLNIKAWEASDDNFPRLQRLVVRRCRSLDKIPEEFGNMGELMGIEVHWCKTSLRKSVLKIKRDQTGIGNMKFEAIINPPVLDLSVDEDLSE